MSDRPKGERSSDGELAPEESAAAATDPDGSPLAGNGQPRDDVALEPGTLTQARQMLAELRPELADLEARLRDAEDRHLRDRAELENFKRRMQRERAEALRYASEGVIRDLLPVVDNLARAIRAAAESRTDADGHAATGALITGVELVHRQLLEALGRHGATRIEAKGRPFDPALHEAVLQVETDEVPPGTVVEELAPGYRLHDRLLRAAQVSVAKAPSQRETQREN